MTAPSTAAPEPDLAGVRRLGDPVLDIWVPGVAQPKGSKTAVPRGGRIIQIEAADFNNDGALTAWSRDIVRIATSAWRSQPALDEPVHLVAEFWMPRPSSYRATASYRRTKPDVDKLARATGDALKAAGVLFEDSRIVDLRAVKRVCRKGETAGVRLRVWPLGLWESEGWVLHVDHPVLVRRDGAA